MMTVCLFPKTGINSQNNPLDDFHPCAYRHPSISAKLDLCGTMIFEGKSAIVSAEWRKQIPGKVSYSSKGLV